MIRPARPDDAPAIRALLAENGLLADGLQYDAWSPITLVYERRDGEIAGMVQAIPARPYAIIVDVAVARAHHRKGYGVRLMEHVETVLREYGATAWVGFSREKDDMAARVAEGAGARCTGDGVGWVKAL